MRVWAVIGIDQRGQRTVAAICATVELAAREIGRLVTVQLHNGAPIGECAYHIDAGGRGMGFEVVE